MVQKIKVMDLRTRKYTAIEKIMNLDEEAMKKLEASLNDILSEEISLEEYNREIDEADAAIDRGEYVEHEEAIKRIKAWR